MLRARALDLAPGRVAARVVDPARRVPPLATRRKLARKVTIDPEAKDGTQIGKRYVNEAGDLELLCTKPGEGSLASGGTALTLKSAKPLPSSD